MSINYQEIPQKSCVPCAKSLAYLTEITVFNPVKLVVNCSLLKQRPWGHNRLHGFKRAKAYF